MVAVPLAARGMVHVESLLSASSFSAAVNCGEVLTTVPLLRSMANRAIVGSAPAAAQVIIAAPAGHTLATRPFRGRLVLRGRVIIALMIAMPVPAIPLHIVVAHAGAARCLHRADRAFRHLRLRHHPLPAVLRERPRRGARRGLPQQALADRFMQAHPETRIGIQAPSTDRDEGRATAIRQALAGDPPGVFKVGSHLLDEFAATTSWRRSAT